MTSAITSQKLIDLAARCESATGPDRELDAAIGRALGISPVGLTSISFPHDPATERFVRFTASLDAALTLVPEGWGGKLFFSEDRPDREVHCSATLARSYPTNAQVYAEKSGKHGARSAMPLALCAASLRARANDTGEQA